MKYNQTLDERLLRMLLLSIEGRLCAGTFTVLLLIG